MRARTRACARRPRWSSRAPIATRRASCRAFVSDPPLKKVVARTIEIGARGRHGAEGLWSAALFRTELHDDLQFIAAGSGATNAGYFANVGTTRRQGLELATSARLAAWFGLA